MTELWLELARERIRKHPPRFSPLSNAVVDYMVVEMARGFRDVAEATDAYVKAIAIEQGRLRECDWEGLNESHQRAVARLLLNTAGRVGPQRKATPETAQPSSESSAS
jgi:hypothetical protein